MLNLGLQDLDISIAYTIEDELQKVISLEEQLWKERPKKVTVLYAKGITLILQVFLSRARHVKSCLNPGRL